MTDGVGLEGLCELSLWNFYLSGVEQESDSCLSIGFGSGRDGVEI